MGGVSETAIVSENEINNKEKEEEEIAILSIFPWFNGVLVK